MFCKIARCTCFCHVSRFNPWRSSINTSYVAARSCSTQVQIQSIDAAFCVKAPIQNATVTSLKRKASMSDGAPPLSPSAIDTNSVTFPLDLNGPMNNSTIERISKHLKSSGNSLVSESEHVLQRIAVHLASHPLQLQSRSVSTKMHGLMVDIIRLFALNGKLPSKQCMECMVQILLSSPSPHSMRCIYSLIHFSSSFDPVSFESYISVIESALSMELSEFWTKQHREEYVRSTLHLLARSHHKDQSELDHLASLYEAHPLHDAASPSHILFSDPDTGDTPRNRLIHLLRSQPDSATLSIEELSSLYQGTFHEMLPLQLVIEPALQQLRQMATVDTAPNPVPPVALPVAVPSSSSITSTPSKQWDISRWRHAPDTVSKFLFQLHQTLSHQRYHSVYDIQIPRIWRKVFFQREMGCLERCISEQLTRSTTKHDDAYKVLTQLPRRDLIGFRVLSVLLYSWDTVQVRYDSYRKSWKYVLRDAVNADVNVIDEAMPSLHRWNIHRILGTKLVSRQWSLSEVMDEVETYLTAECRVNFPEESYRRHSLRNNLFPSIIDLFPCTRFSWQLDRNAKVRTINQLHSGYWHTALLLNQSVMDQIESIISCSGRRGILFVDICRKLKESQKAMESPVQIPMESELITGYGHRFQVYVDQKREHRFRLRMPHQVSKLMHFQNRIADHDLNPVQKICKLLCCRPTPWTLISNSAAAPSSHSHDSNRREMSRFRKLQNRRGNAQSTQNPVDRQTESRFKLMQNVHSLVGEDNGDDIATQLSLTYDTDLTIQSIADLYESQYGILMVDRIDKLLQKMGFIVDPRCGTLQFVGALPPNVYDRFGAGLKSILEPFTIRSQVFAAFYNSDGEVVAPLIESGAFCHRFANLYGYGLPLSAKQFYFYLYHQFYPFLSVDAFDAAKESFVIRLDHIMWDEKPCTVEVMSPTKWRNEMREETRCILEQYPDGIEFHSFWKQLQNDRNRVLYLDFRADQEGNQGILWDEDPPTTMPMSMFEEMRQFTTYSAQWMAFWDDISVSSDISWSAFVAESNCNDDGDIRIYLKPDPKQVSYVLFVTLCCV